MRVRAILTGIIITLLLTGCSKDKKFDFNGQWTWQDLKAFTDNEDTHRLIDNIKKLVPLDDTRYLFREISRFETPEDVYNLTAIEKRQNQLGGGFFGVIPNHFDQKSRIPLPTDFDKTIRLGLYLSKVRTNNIRDLITANIGYHINFKNEEINDTSTPGPENIHLTVDFSLLEDILDYYNNFENEQLQTLAENNIFDNMIAARRENKIIPSPYPQRTDYLYFLGAAAMNNPERKIWNWLNPANNFGFSEFYTNRHLYSEFIDYIKKNSRNFTNPIAARLSDYLPADVTFTGELQFAVNFGQNIWSAPNSVGFNIAQIKDNYPVYFKGARKEIFKQLHSELCIKSPDKKNNFQYEDIKYWNFETEEDRKFYRILAFTYMEGVSTYISGSPKGFNFFMQAKQSVSYLEQVYNIIYKTKKEGLLTQMEVFGMEPYGPLTGLGYLMARTIETYFGKEELIRCIQNGPVYFFDKFYEHRKTIENPTFVHITDTVAKKITDLYDLQKQYYQ